MAVESWSFPPPPFALPVHLFYIKTGITCQCRCQGSLSWSSHAWRTQPGPGMRRGPCFRLRAVSFLLCLSLRSAAVCSSCRPSSGRTGGSHCVPAVRTAGSFVSVDRRSEAPCLARYREPSLCTMSTPYRLCSLTFIIAPTSFEGSSTASMAAIRLPCSDPQNSAWRQPLHRHTGRPLRAVRPFPARMHRGGLAPHRGRGLPPPGTSAGSRSSR